MHDSSELNESIQQAVIHYSDSLIKIAFTYLKSVADAEEAVQDVFLTYLQKSPVFASREHQKAWLIRAVINRSKNMLKNAWLKRRSPITDDLSYLQEEEQTIMQEVLSLDKKYRLPIHLHYYEGYSIEEIAHILQAKPATDRKSVV